MILQSNPIYRLLLLQPCRVLWIVFPNTNHQLLQRPEIESFLVQHFDLSILDLSEASFLMLIRRISLDIVCFMCMGAGTLISHWKMLTSVRVDDHIDMVIFADRGCSSMCKPWSVQNGLIYSKPKSHFFSGN